MPTGAATVFPLGREKLGTKDEEHAHVSQSSFLQLP